MFSSSDKLPADTDDVDSSELIEQSSSIKLLGLLIRDICDKHKWHGFSFVTIVV